MPTTNLAITRDTRIAVSGSFEAGAGASHRNPVGVYSGYTYQTLMQFASLPAGTTGVTSAILHLWTSDQFYVAFGLDPDVTFYRLTEDFAEGTATSLSSTNATTWTNRPSHTNSGAVTVDVPTTQSTEFTVDITAILQAAAAEGVWWGLKIAAVTSDASDVTEFWAREAGSTFDPYVELVYTTDAPPDAPVLTAPAAGAITTLTPTMSATISNGSGDLPITSYHIQVSTSSTFSTLHADMPGLGTGINNTGNPNSVSRVYDGTALVRGTTYYWRMRGTNAEGTGAWSASRTLIANTLPTATITGPASADGQLLQLTYSAGSGWASPRPVVAWTFGDANSGHAQTAYQVLIDDATAGTGPWTNVYDSGKVISGVKTLTPAITLTESRYYRVQVRVWDSLDEASAYAVRIGRARWGLGVYKTGSLGTVTSWSLASVQTTEGTTSDVVLEYGGNSTDVTPTTWYSSIASAPVGATRRFFYRVWLLAWGSASPASPSLNELSINYTANALQPDKWTQSEASAGVIDLGTFVYGHQSMRLDGDGALRYYEQTVDVVPATDYVLSGRVKTLGVTGARIYAVDAGGVELATTETINVTRDWDRYSIKFNSGSLTSVKVRVAMTGAVGTQAWFDALKIEASLVVTPWTPALVGAAVVVDAGGLQVDASQGGIMRLRGSAGGTRDRVDLGANGLRLGNDSTVELYSPSAGIMKTLATLESGPQVSSGRSTATEFLAAGASDPSSVEGTLRWNTSTRQLMVHDGTQLSRQARGLVKSANQASTSTTLADVTDLIFPVGIGRYGFEFVLFFQSAALTTGIAATITGPAASAGRVTMQIMTTDAASSDSDFTASRALGGSYITASVATINTPYHAILRGFGVFTAAGTVRPQFATEVAGSAVTVLAGSYGILI